MPIIAGRRKASWPPPPHHAQQRVVAHRDVEPARKGGCRFASESDSKTVDNIVEPPRASGSWRDRLEPFGKDPPLAGRRVAEEAAGPQNQRYSHAGGRKIRQSPSILAVHAATNASAHRTSANARRDPYPDYQAAIVFGRALNDKSARNKFRNVKPLHGSDPLPESKPNRRLDFIKSESEPNRDPRG
jgi:hypothetical protein